jgi:hypothetical protein
MRSISRKLRDLEKNVVSDTPKTKTVLYIEDPDEREIHKRAGEILTRQREIAVELQGILKANPKAEVNMRALDLTSDEKAIVDKSNSLYRHRVMELFDNGVAQYVHLNDPVNKWIFYSRLNWFLREMKDWLFLRWQEDQVYDDPEFFNLCAGEQEKRLKPIYSRWREWLSEDSWNEYYVEHEQQRVSDFIREPTAEEVEEDRKRVEQDNAEEEARDARFLKEKCPSCTEKCSWYYEKVKEKVAS